MGDSMTLIDRLHPTRSQRDIVTEHETPKVDGEMAVYKAGLGFWGRRCSECGLQTVNGSSKGFQDPFAMDAEFEYVDKHKSGKRRDGTIVYDSIYRCPECDAELVKVKDYD